MQYIGSLYAQDFTSSELKEIAYNQLDISGMPPNGFTVQALLLTAISMHAEDEMERARIILDRAIYMALEIRMNSRTFANMERDPVLAESWRRTYWGLYVTDSMFAGTRRAASFMSVPIYPSLASTASKKKTDYIQSKRTSNSHAKKQTTMEFVIPTLTSSTSCKLTTSRSSPALVHFPNTKRAISRTRNRFSLLLLT